MSKRGILDADMHTLGQWLLEGWRWWTGELSALVPASLRRRGGERLEAVAYRVGALEPAASAARRIAVVLPAGCCLIRRIDRPAMRDGDVAGMLRFEADTLFPYSADEMVLAWARAGGATSGRMALDLAALPIETARDVAAAVATYARVAVRVIVARDGPAPLQPIDFAPEMRRRGLLPAIRSARSMLWSLVAFLALLNIGFWTWRDAETVARLEAVVREQQPALAVAQTMTRRADQDRRLVTRTLALRRSRDALGTLAAVGGALPEGAWLQRYSWDGAMLRIAGYRPVGSDVAGALRRTGRFGQLRQEGAQTDGALPVGEPFDLSAKVVR